MRARHEEFPTKRDVFHATIKLLHKKSYFSEDILLTRCASYRHNISIAARVSLIHEVAVVFGYIVLGWL